MPNQLFFITIKSIIGEYLLGINFTKYWILSEKSSFAILNIDLCLTASNSSLKDLAPSSSIASWFTLKFKLFSERCLEIFVYEMKLRELYKCTLSARFGDPLVNCLHDPKNAPFFLRNRKRPKCGS